MVNFIQGMIIVAVFSLLIAVAVTPAVMYFKWLIAL